MDDEKYQEIIQRKCPDCYLQKENACIMTSYARAVMCLGPFKDLKDRLEKTREEDDDKEDIARKEINRFKRKTRLDEYLINKMLFEHRVKRGNSNDANK